jgi:undecaprenol kinase
MRSFIYSFKYAGSGILKVFLNERNFRIELLVFILSATMGFIFKISHIEWFFMLLFSCIVLSLEMLNTAVELFMDLNINRYNILVERIKDITAGGVLISSIFALITGLIIFIPHFFKLFKQ